MQIIQHSSTRTDNLVACSKSNDEDAVQFRTGLDEAPVEMFKSFDYGSQNNLHLNTLMSSKRIFYLLQWI